MSLSPTSVAQINEQQRSAHIRQLVLAHGVELRQRCHPAVALQAMSCYGH